MNRGYKEIMGPHYFCQEKAKKLFQNDNTDLPLPFVNKVLNEIIGEPSLNEKKDINQRITNKL